MRKDSLGGKHCTSKVPTRPNSDSFDPRELKIALIPLAFVFNQNNNSAPPFNQNMVPHPNFNQNNNSAIVFNKNMFPATPLNKNMIPNFNQNNNPGLNQNMFSAPNLDLKKISVLLVGKSEETKFRLLSTLE